MIERKSTDGFICNNCGRYSRCVLPARVAANGRKTCLTCEKSMLRQKALSDAKKRSAAKQRAGRYLRGDVAWFVNRDGESK